MARHSPSLRLTQTIAVNSFAVHLARDNVMPTDDGKDLLVPIMVPLALAARVTKNIESWQVHSQDCILLGHNVHFAAEANALIRTRGLCSASSCDAHAEIHHRAAVGRHEWHDLMGEPPKRPKALESAAAMDGTDVSIGGYSGVGCIKLDGCMDLDRCITSLDSCTASTACDVSVTGDSIGGAGSDGSDGRFEFGALTNKVDQVLAGMVLLLDPLDRPLAGHSDSQNMGIDASTQWDPLYVEHFFLDDGDGCSVGTDCCDKDFSCRC